MFSTRFIVLYTLIAAGAAPDLAGAQIPDSARAAAVRDSARARALEPVRVFGRSNNLIGRAATASEGYVGAAELRARPRTREGELLETVPGLIVTQHSGEGKANQYFVRGFNLDHGTDFRTTVEGMPVNMPSHGHGQGWTDLNFLIPELVDHLDYKLGVYHAELGDFGSAGGAEFRLVSALSRPIALAEYGANQFARIALGGSMSAGPGTLLVGGEAKRYDGPWEQPQRLRKFNALARYSWGAVNSRFSVLAMAYRNQWNATDQIPSRAVARGLVSRFGQIDSTDGGNAQRYSLSGGWTRVGASSVQRVELFGIHSGLDLVSNFTYFLTDPERGDQFAQTDYRTVLGGSASDRRTISAFGTDHAMTFGLQTRADIIDGLDLTRTVGRERIGTVRSDRVRETGTGVYAEAVSQWLPRFRSVLGMRADLYTFDVRGDRVVNSGNRTAGIVSPKASLVFTPSPKAELYASGGFGFHSNDARGTTITVDPATGDAADRVDPLVRSRGAELGLRVTPVRAMQSTVSLWALNLDSELVFTGDGGATEPSAASRRAGITLANFYRPWSALALDADVSFARARFDGNGGPDTHIPGALENVIAGGAAWNPARGAFGALRLRHFGAYPLAEDNARRARATTLLNADVGYQLTSGIRLQANLLNVLNARADDIQYLYASRLPGEAAGGVDDVHFHPAEPRQVRVSLGWRF